METIHNGRPPEPRPGRRPSIERALLLAVLDPPEFGGSVSELARQLGEPEGEIATAAARLEEKCLARLGNGHVVASGAALDLDALWPLAI
jgi:hypothetical protein